MQKLYMHELTDDQLKVVNKIFGERSSGYLYVDKVEDDVYELKIHKTIKYLHVYNTKGFRERYRFGEFIHYLDKIGVSKRIISLITFYHFGDDTENGRGVTRYETKDVNVIYKNQIKLINNYFRSHRFDSKLIEYAFKPVDKKKMYYLFKKDDRDFLVTYRELKELLKEDTQDDCLRIGPFNYSSYDRNTSFQGDREYYRNYCLLKINDIVRRIK